MKQRWNTPRIMYSDVKHLPIYQRLVIQTGKPRLCPLCGGQLRVIADITEPALITKILDHVQNRDPPRQAPLHSLGRAPPHSDPYDRFVQR